MAEDSGFVMDSKLTVAIPSLRNVDAALDKAEWIRSQGFAGELLVSINDAPEANNRMVLDRAKRLSASIFFQEHNIGLYGNFRFLMGKASSPHFMWVALDDQPPSQWLNDEFSGYDADLEVCELVLKEFVNNELGTTKFSFSPDKYFFGSSPFEIQPGYIFGVWKTEFLKRIWPEKTMDWLDSYILLVARLEGRVAVAPSEFRSTIGYAEKAPQRVNGKFHNPFGWAMTVIRFMRFGRPFSMYWEFLSSLRVRSRFSIGELFEYLVRRYFMNTASLGGSGKTQDLQD